MSRSSSSSSKRLKGRSRPIRPRSITAGALEMNGKTDEALAAARAAAEAQKESPRFASRVAWIEYHAKRNADAKKSYAELVQKFDSVHDSAEARDVLRDARLVLSNLYV